MSKLSNEFLKSRLSHEFVVLEGFHPVKHAIRFGAKIIKICSNNKQQVIKLAQSKSPDIIDFLENNLHEISQSEYNSLAPKPPKTGVIAIAQKPKNDLAEVYKTSGKIVFLENVRSLDNLGAVIRVCAGQGIQAVLCSGSIDPYHPTCIRASRGLHFALPVIKINELPNSHKNIIVFDENGEDFSKVDYSANSILIFGSERSGVSKDLKSTANETLSIPMKSGVSSLNLATSVAIAIYK